MTDGNGTIDWAADYLPFGLAEITVETVVNNLRFPGQYFDAETGLHYNYWRYYDPSLGRYLRVDPIGLEGGMNPYVYVGDNPINLFDLFGLEPGDSFKTIDAAAIDAIEYVRFRTKENKKEYGGFIYQMNDGYSYTKPVRGEKSEADCKEFNKPPKGHDIKAIYHTHVGQDYNAKLFSTFDYLTSDSYGVPIYLGTERKYIKVWKPNTKKDRVIRQGY